jgi:hypothetical protein
MKGTHFSEDLVVDYRKILKPIAEVANESA